MAVEGEFRTHEHSAARTNESRDAAALWRRSRSIHCTLYHFLPAVQCSVSSHCTHSRIISICRSVYTGEPWGLLGGYRPLPLSDYTMYISITFYRGLILVGNFHFLDLFTKFQVTHSVATCQIVLR